MPYELSEYTSIGSLFFYFFNGPVSHIFGVLVTTEGQDILGARPEFS